MLAAEHRNRLAKPLLDGPLSLNSFVITLCV